MYNIITNVDKIYFYVYNVIEGDDVNVNVNSKYSYRRRSKK
nr:MAG TPA: hypothetical protein [Caudoviricetes sp.]